MLRSEETTVTHARQHEAQVEGGPGEGAVVAQQVDADLATRLQKLASQGGPEAVGRYVNGLRGGQRNAALEVMHQTFGNTFTGLALGHGDAVGLETNPSAKAADPALEPKRLAFEDKLATYGHSAPESNAAMEQMCRMAWDWMEAKASVIMKGGPDAAERLKAIVKKLGVALDGDDILRFGGRVGTHFATLKAVFLNNGNLRERVNLLNSFITFNWGADVLKNDEDVVRQILERVNWGPETDQKILDKRTEMLEAGQTSSKHFVQGAGAGNTVMDEKNKKIGPEYDKKLAPIPVEELESKLLRGFARQKGIAVDDLETDAEVVSALKARGITMTPGGELDPRAWSHELRQDHAVTSDAAMTRHSQKDAALLSHREEKGVNPLGPEYQPGLRGDMANVLNEDHPWIKMARDASMPLRGGPSGTSERFMNANTLLGAPVPHSHVRLAMLGFFPLQRGHSFHEIMTACAGHGDCSYSPGMYYPVAPVPDDLLAAWGAGELSKPMI